MVEKVKQPHKLWLFLLALVALAACTDTGKPLARIQDTGVLRVAMDPSFPPFEFVDGEGNLIGLDVDLAREIATRLGVEVQFVSISYDGLYDALTVGKADIIISALYPDPTRTHAFIFSPSYFNAGEVLVVPKESPISKIDDLAGRRVALVYGTEGHGLVLEWEQILSPPPEVLTADIPDVAIGVVAAGIADAAVVDNVSTQVALTRTPGLQVLMSVSNEPYVVATRQEDGALMRTIDTILDDMKNDGTLDRIVHQWMH